VLTIASAELSPSLLVNSFLVSKQALLAITNSHYTLRTLSSISFLLLSLSASRSVFVPHVAASVWKLSSLF